MKKYRADMDKPAISHHKRRKDGSCWIHLCGIGPLRQAVCLLLRSLVFRLIPSFDARVCRSRISRGSCGSWAWSQVHVFNEIMEWSLSSNEDKASLLFELFNASIMSCQASKPNSHHGPKNAKNCLSTQRN